MFANLHIVTHSLLPTTIFEMTYNPISSALALFKQVFAGEVINNQLNPLHLAVATNGYRIQSHTLQIPDQLGFFSSGPPRLQAFEGCTFLVATIFTCLFLTWDFSLVFFGPLFGLPNCRKAGVALALVIFAQAFVSWLLVVCNKRRAPGYEWEDWKVRKD